MKDRTDHILGTPVDIRDLPTWSSWPARLLGLEPWKKIERTTGKVEQEYGREKYAACRAYLDAHPSASPQDVKQSELGNLQKETCLSVGEDLYASTIGKAWKDYCDAIIDRLDPVMKETDVVCDLGCGYGYHLWLLKQRYPGKKFWGGEFTKSAVAIAERMYGNGEPRVEQLDLTNPEWSVPFSKNDRVLVLSVYAYHQLPTCRGAVERLAAIKGPGWNVCHVEPVLQWCPDSLLGKLRSAYTVANDYNRDLLPSLEAVNAKIVRSEKEFFGLNPLHPASFIHWR